MDLDKSLVCSMIRDGKAAVLLAMERGVKLEYLGGDGQTALDFVFHYFKEHRAAPTSAMVLGKTGVDLEKVDGASAFFIDEVLNRQLQRGLQLGVEGAIDLMKGRDPRGALDALEALVRASRREIVATSKVEGIGPLAQKVQDLYERVKAGERGILTPWPTVNEETFGFWPQDLVIFVGRLGKGKCLDVNSEIVDATTGYVRTLQEVLETPEITSVPSWCRSRGIVPEHVAAKIDSGYRECLKVTLRTGREFVVTPEHLALSVDDWKETGSLSVGDFVALPVQIPDPFEFSFLTAFELDMLAVLLSEGSYTGHHIGYSNIDATINEIVAQAAYGLGLQVKPTGEGQFDFTDASGSRRNSARELLREFGIDDCLAKDKRIPDVVFGLERAALARFLGLFWMCDGFVDNNAPSVILASEKMVRQIQHLLLRFGIQSRVRYKPATCSGKIFDSWHLKVYSQFWERFLTVIPLWGEKRERLEALCARPSNPNVGFPRVSKELKDRIRKVSDAQSGRWCGGKLKEVGERLGWSSKFMFRSLFGQNDSLLLSRFRVFCEVFGCADQFGPLLDDSIFWDEIVSIDPVGVRKVGDLNIPGTSSFVSNDVVLHNSWLAIAVTEFAWRSGHKVLFATTEMSKIKIVQRFSAYWMKLPYDDIRKGRLGVFAEKKFYDGVQELLKAEGLVFVGGDFDFTIGSFESAVEESDPALTVLDGAYLLRVDGNTRTEQAANAFNELKRMAHRRMIPFFVTSQLNREAKGSMGGNKISVDQIALTDVAGWNGDVIYGVVQDDDMKKDGKMALKPLKLREGIGIEELELNWNFDTMDFTEIPKDASDAADSDYDTGMGALDGDPAVPF